MKHLKDINWNHLYYFYEVARLHSIKKVSEFTKHSPSTISEQIKKLETKLNTPLFNRTKSGLFLTQRGEALYDHARVMFEEGYRLLEKFSSDEVGGYPVNVGVDSGILSPLSSQFISNYWDLYTRYGVVNVIRQADHDVLIQNIAQGNIDWGLSLSPSKRKSLTSHVVQVCKLQLCVADFIDRKFKEQKDIPLYLPYIETAWDHPLKNKIHAHLRASNTIFNESCHTDNFDYMLRLVKKGRAITFLPETIIEEHSDLVALQASQMFELPIYAIWKKSNEDLISISTLKSMAVSSLQPHSSDYLQLEVSEVPEDKLKN